MGQAEKVRNGTGEKMIQYKELKTSDQEMVDVLGCCVNRGISHVAEKLLERSSHFPYNYLDLYYRIVCARIKYGIIEGEKTDGFLRTKQILVTHMMIHPNYDGKLDETIP